MAVCGSNGFNTEPHDTPNEPHARPPGGFPSAFNRGFPIEPSVETLSRVHTRTQVRGVPKGHSSGGEPRQLASFCELAWRCRCCRFFAVAATA